MSFTITVAVNATSRGNGEGPSDGTGGGGGDDEDLQLFQVCVSREMDVRDLGMIIEVETGLKQEEQVLLCEGKKIEMRQNAAHNDSDVRTVEELGLKDGDVVMMMKKNREERNRGGTAMSHSESETEKKFLSRLQGGLSFNQRYSRVGVLETARAIVPYTQLREKVSAKGNGYESSTNECASNSHVEEIGDEDKFVKELLAWFKTSFFEWVNTPSCERCPPKKNNAKNDTVRATGVSSPQSQIEVNGEASRIELYQCEVCGAAIRFPRYNNPVTLLHTRKGRCGEVLLT